MTQTTLNFDSPPRQHHSPTSYAAANRIAPIAGTMRYQVLEHIRLHGPISDNELIAAFGGRGNSIRPRRVELAKAGLIAKSGVRGGSTTWKVV